MFDSTYWTAPAVVALLSLIYTIYYNKYKKNKPNSEQHIINNPSIINNIGIQNVTSNNAVNSQEHNTIDYVKVQAQTHILFIDDEKFDIVDSLKSAGWVNTVLTKKVKSLRDPKILEADIIFVDINGVAANLFRDEGLGLARELKTTYPQKKIILYSSETTGNRFDPTLKMVDDTLAKNAEPFEFISLVERFVL